jgi:hypothetical protein
LKCHRAVFWSFEDEVEDFAKFTELSDATAKPNNYRMHGTS